ncbi:MAG: metallophosphoesterase [Bdellovibrionales bacterium]|nr:metallophosphoesterase [Bdellovibrionales bacterium]
MARQIVALLAFALFSGFLTSCGENEDLSTWEKHELMEDRYRNLKPLSFSEFSFDNHEFKSQLNILVGGDTGHGNHEQYRVADGMKKSCNDAGGCDFVIFAGDNIYHYGVKNIHDPKFHDYFEDQYKVLGHLDIWMILGNHDWMGSVQSQVNYTKVSSKWKLPFMHYQIPKLPSWLRIQMSDIMLESEINGHMKSYFCGYDGWKIFVEHHPLYSNGEHGGNAKQQNHIQPIIEECGVQLAIGGHDHDLELIDIEGKFLQLVSGAASEVRTIASDADPTHNQLFASEKTGFNILEMDATHLTIHFFDHDGNEVYSKSFLKGP